MSSYRPGGVPLGGAPQGWALAQDDEEVGSTISDRTGFHLELPNWVNLESTGGRVGGGCCCCAFLAFLIMLLSSFKGLHATEFGILRNTFTGVVSFGNTYHGGRNFIGFWNDYLIFPATINSIEWLPGPPRRHATRDLSPMNVRTADGLMVELGIVTQYRVVREKIPEIYKTCDLRMRASWYTKRMIGNT